MRIRNPAMCDVELGTPAGVVRGDARGVFEVPEDFGNRLIRTPGWSAVAEGEPDTETIKRRQEVARKKAADEAHKAAEALAQAESARAAQREAEEQATRAAPTIRADEETADRLAAEGRALEQGAEAEEVGPDLEALDKAGLLLVAKEYDVKVDARWAEDKLRAVLDKAIYEGEGS